MFSDDITLVREAIERHGLLRPVVECGGLEDPCIADYQRTIDAMAAIDPRECTPATVEAAQRARYLSIHRPLSFVGPYRIENPETGGLTIAQVAQQHMATIGTVIVLSVLEHVDDPRAAVWDLWRMLRAGGLAIVSVPFAFPYHPHAGEDNWRFTPTGLRHLFSPAHWEVLECDWRLDIPATAGVLDDRGLPQIVKSCYIIARAKEASL